MLKAGDKLYIAGPDRLSEADVVELRHLDTDSCRIASWRTQQFISRASINQWSTGAWHTTPARARAHRIYELTQQIADCVAEIERIQLEAKHEADMADREADTTQEETP